MACSHSTLNDDPRVAPRSELPDDDPTADSLAEAIEGCDGDIELLEPLQFSADQR